MNVLLLTKYNVFQGGVSDVLLTLKKYLPNYGVFPTIYTCNISGEDNTQDENILFGMLPRPGYLNFFKNKKTFNRLLSLCREREIAIIHAHGAYRPAFAARHLAKVVGIPYVVTSHGDIIPSASRRMRRRSGRLRFSRYLSDAAALTHLNPYMKSIVTPLVGHAAKHVTIPNGVELASWRNCSTACAYASRARGYILGIGRLDKGKGFDFLLDSYCEALESGLKESLVIVGDGPLKAQLMEYARKSGLNVADEEGFLTGENQPTVFFVGYQTGTVKRDYISNALYVTFPSQAEEAFGIILLEAMAAGKSLVACDLPATGCLINHGVNGLISKCGDVSGFSKSLRKLAHDKTLRIDMEKRNQKDVLQYDWASIVSKYAELYFEIVQNQNK